MSAQAELFGGWTAPKRESEVQKGHRIVSEIASLPDRRAYLERVRFRMRSLYEARYRDQGERASVTPDDARRVFEAMGPPATMSRNFLAAVFREPGWEVVGTYRSATENSHGNRLNAYAWRG